MVDEDVKDELILKAAELEIEKLKMAIEHKRAGEQRLIEAHAKYVWEVDNRAECREKEEIKNERWIKHLDDTDKRNERINASCKDQRDQLKRLADTLDLIAKIIPHI